MNENEIKDLLYDLAMGIVDLFHENAELREINKQLKKYKEKREQEDQEYLQHSQKQVSKTLATLLRANKEENNNERQN